MYVFSCPINFLANKNTVKLKVSKDKQPIKYRKTRMVGQLNGITNIDSAVPGSFPELSGAGSAWRDANRPRHLCTYTTLNPKTCYGNFLNFTAL